VAAAGPLIEPPIPSRQGRQPLVLRDAADLLPAAVFQAVGTAGRKTRLRTVSRFGRSSGRLGEAVVPDETTFALSPSLEQHWRTQAIFHSDHRVGWKERRLVAALGNHRRRDHHRGDRVRRTPADPRTRR